MSDFYNLDDYLKWRGDISFNVSSFNEIDAAIFSFISYIDIREYINGVTNLGYVLHNFFNTHTKENTKLGLLIPNNIIDLFETMSTTNRFDEIGVSDVTKNINTDDHEQFGAATYHLQNNLLVICFEGTDDSFAGWVENLYLINNKPVLCQTKAAAYVKRMVDTYSPAGIYICGHSKGGNMAVYAACAQEKYIQDLIIKVGNFDGPGINPDFFPDEQLNNIKNKVYNYIPQHSCVSQFFTSIGKTIVCKSKARGILQHDLLTWNLMSNAFIRTNLSNDSIQFHKQVNNFIDSLQEEEKLLLCNAIDKLVKEAELTSLLKIHSSITKLLPALKTITLSELKILIKFTNIMINYHML